MHLTLPLHLLSLPLAWVVKNRPISAARASPTATQPGPAARVTKPLHNVREFYHPGTMTRALAWVQEGQETGKVIMTGSATALPVLGEEAGLFFRAFQFVREILSQGHHGQCWVPGTTLRP